MGILEGILIVVGMSSVALLWAFSAMAMIHVTWDTLGEPLQLMLESLKKKG